MTKTTSVEYTASDGSLTDTATLTVTVTGTNDGLTANDDAGTTTENTELTVADGATGTMTVNRDLLLNDVDIDGDDLTITEVDGESSSVGKATSGSDGGSFTIRANGSWEFNPGTDFDDLKAGVTKTTSVEYTASDGSLTDTATLTVTVTGANDGLTANDDAGTTTENTELTVADGATGTTSGTTTGPGGGAQRVNADLLLNDVDIDSDDLTITEVDGDTGSVGKATSGSDGGSFTIRANGSWEFNPGTDFDDLKAGVTKTTSVEYTASDGSLTDTATLTVTVTGTNDGLTANDDAGTTTENTDLTVADGATGTTSGTTPGPGGGAQRVNADLLLNDVDIDGDDLTITEVDGESSSVGKATDGSDGGSFTIDSKGGWTFDPNSDFDDLAAGVTRTTSVVYTASDGTLTDTATLTVTVTGTNDGLTANDDAGTTTENKMLTVADGATGTTSGTTPGPGGGAQRVNADLLLNDVDIDGDDLTITEVDGDTSSVGKATSGSDGGSFTLRANGSWEFNPGTDFDDLKAGVTKTTSVEYTASDGTLTDTATLTVTVTGANDGLTANDDAGTTTENTELTVADGATGTTSGTTTTNADLLLNDVDIDGDDLTITEVDGDTASVGKATDGSDGGSFTIRANGSWEFNPGTDFDDLKAGVTKTTSVEYTASDGSLTDTATLTVTVTGEADARTLTPATGEVTEDAADDAGNLVASGKVITSGDAGDDQFKAATLPGTYGSLTIDANGAWTWTVANNDPDIQGLKATESPTDTFTVSSADGAATTTITITINGADDVPVLMPSAGSVTEDSVNDDGDLVATGTLSISGGDADEDQFLTTPVTGAYGSLTIAADGAWTYTADNSQSAIQALGVGDTLTDTLTVTSADTVTMTTVTITINGAADGVTDEDTVLTVKDGATATTTTIITDDKGSTSTITGNADLLLDDTSTVTRTITRVSGDTIVPVVDARDGSTTGGRGGGQFTIKADGSWTFDPDGDFNDLAKGEIRTTSVLYTVVTVVDGSSDTATARLTVTVTGENDAPTAEDDTGRTTQNTAITVADDATGTTSTATDGAGLLLNDSDPDANDTLTITAVNGESASVGKAVDGSDGGSFTLNKYGSWKFDPGTAFDDLAAGATRTTQVTYTMSDGTATDTATLTVTVTGVNDAPVAVADSGAFTVTADNSVLTVADGAGDSASPNSDLLLNDTDAESDTLTISRVAGSATNVGKAIDGSNGGSFTLNKNGSWEFNPGDDFDDLKAGETRTTSVAYTASDVNGATSATPATLTVTVTGINDAPVANDDAGATTENAKLTVADGTGDSASPNSDLLLNDTDADTGTTLTITEVGGDTASVGKAVDGSDGGSFTIDSKGGWTFDPDGNKDNNFDDLKKGETRTTSVEYTVSDGTLTDTATVTVTVTGTNDAPTANADTGRTSKDRVRSVANDAAGGGNGLNADLLLNDEDIDGDSLTIAAVGSNAQNLAAANIGKAIAGTGGGQFTIRADGSWEFDPDGDFDDLEGDDTGTASVEYRATDGNGGTAMATLTVTVYASLGVTAVDDAGTTAENTVLNVADSATGITSGTITTNADLLLNDIDLDGDTLTITGVNGVAANIGTAVDGTNGGKFTLKVDGSWSFDPGTSFDDLAVGKTRTTSVDYTASDGSETDTATLTVTVTGVNDGLTADDDTGVTTENAKLTVADGATGTIITNTDNTTTTINADLLLNDKDIDGDTLSISAVGGDAANVGTATAGTDENGKAGGTFTIRADGSWEFNPGTDFDDLELDETRTTSVQYTASDSNGGTNTATLTVTVTGQHDGTTPTADFGTTDEDTVLNVAKDATGTTTSGTTTNGVTTNRVTTNAGLLLNDNEFNGNGLTITRIVSSTIATPGSSVPGIDENGKAGGSFTIAADGSWKFDPGTDFDDLKAGETRTTSVAYRVSGSDGGSGEATLTVTVTGTNDLPMAVDDTGATTENTKLTVADGAEGTTSGTTTVNADLLLNDTDADGDTLSLGISAVGGDAANVGKATAGTDENGNAGGTFTIRADGSWEFDPGTDFDNLADGKTRTTSVTYTASDSNGGTSELATLRVTVTGVNDGLTATDDTATTTENTQLKVADGAGDSASPNSDLLLNDVDIDGDTLTITEVGGDTANVGKATDGSKGGSFTIRADGSWDFDPGTAFDDLAAGVTRTTSVEYTASDGSLTDTATLTVTVEGVNDAPTAGDDTGATTENNELTVAASDTGTNAGLLLNDSDPDGDTLSISQVFGRIGGPNKAGIPGIAVDGDNGGKFTIDSKGGWSFDPGEDFDYLAKDATATTLVSYTLSDDKGGFDTANLTVTVTGTNDKPVAVDDTGATKENTKLTVANDAGDSASPNSGLLLNDEDVDGDTLTITEVNGESANVGKATAGTDENGNAGGTFTIRADGSWEFDPGTDFDNLADGKTRTTSVEYTVSDGSLTDTATVKVTVTGEDDAPTAVDDLGTTDKNTVLTVKDGDAGTEITNADSSTMTINADLLLNDTDPESDSLRIIRVDSATSKVGVATAGSNGGLFTISTDGSWSFDPNDAFDDLAVGATRTTSVTYTATDSNGGTDTATLTVIVTGANNAPVAVDDFGATTENKILTVADDATGTTSGTVTTNADLLLNDSDPDSDALTITGVSGYTAAVDQNGKHTTPQDVAAGVQTYGKNGGQFTIESNGAWSFDPGDDFNGLKAGETRTTSVVYTVSDGNDDTGLTDTATLTVTVTGTNDGLTANDDSAATTQNAPLTVADSATGPNADLLLNDVDIDSDDLTITEVGGDTASVGKATAGSGGGSFTIRADGSWDFDPGTAFNDLAAGVTRTTSVVYTASDRNDGTGLTDTATLTVTVTGTNDGLTANDDSAATTQNAPLTVADSATGPNADLLLNDVDIDSDDLTITEVDGDTSNVGKATAGSGGGSFTIRADGSWDFNPGTAFDDLAAGVTKTTSVVYTASDRNDGTGLTDTATLTVTVTGTNDGLTANDDSAATTQNAPLTVADSATGPNADLLLNDVDIDSDDLTITEVGGKSSNVGKATAGSGGGSFTIRADGSWDFNPGTAFDDLAAGVTKTTSVVYTASDRNDGTGLTDTATLTVTVTGTNDGLTANDDSAATTQNAPLTVADSATGPNADLLLNDVDIDSDDLTITEVGGKSANVGKATAGSGGGSFTIRADGSWDFNPGTAFDDLAAGVTKTTSVVYTASDRNDGTGLTDTATLTVTVTGTNDGLTANDDSAATTQNAPLTVADSATGPNADLLLNDVDIDSDDLTITEVGGKSSNVGKATAGSGGGSFTIRADGSWDFNPGTAFDDLAAGVTKTTSVVYTASDRNDGTGLTDTATLTVTVTGTNDGLTANDDSGTTTQNAPLTVADSATGPNADLLLNDVDIDSDDLTITEVDGDTSNVGKATAGSGGGSFTIRADGSWDFNPGTAFDDLAAGVTKTTSVVYTASDRNDGTGLTDTATLTVTVTGTNDGLTANDDSGTTTQNKILTVADDATGTTSGTTTINADLLRNDKDIDSDDLTITEVGGKSANVGKATAGSSGGSFTIRADGSWDFNPGTAFDDLAAGVTKTTSVVYTASDRNDGTGLTDTATLTVTVTGTNDGLTANDDSGTTTQNAPLTVADSATGPNADLLLNDVDIDSDDLTITEVGGKSSSVGKATAGSSGGSFTIRADGSWDFNPGTAFDDLAAGVTKTTSVVYTASDRNDGTGLTDTATLTVTVTGTNDGLTANDDSAATTQNAPLTVADSATGPNADLLLNDVDIDSDDLTITEVGGKSANVGKATAGSGGGSFTIRADGSWDFNPGTAFDDLAAGVTRTTSVVYTASDRNDGTGLTDTATLTVTVTGTNDGLTANDDAGTTTQNAPLTVADSATGPNADLLLNDVDIDSDDLTITEVGGKSSNVGKATAGSGGGSFTIRADGSWDFNPGTAFDDLAAGVTRTTSVVYTASDRNDGTGLTDTAALTVTVTGTNDGLTANDDSAATTQNAPLTVADSATGPNADLLLNDVDIDSDDLTITEVDGDTSNVGKATAGSGGGSFTIRADGSWDFNPGTAFDDLAAGVTRTTSVVYTASDRNDGTGLTDTATLTVTVTGTNDGLTANDDSAATTQNAPLTVADSATGPNADLLLNDVDIDSDDLTITEVDGDTSNVGKATAGSGGGSFTIRADGSWDFNPGTAFDDLAAGVTRTTSVVYTASDRNDGTGLTDTATLTVTVTGTNDGLTANDDSAATTQNAPLTVADSATGPNADLLLNDVDIDSDDLTITEVGGKSANVGKATAGSGGGSFTIRADGSWDFNPGTAFDDLAAGVTRTTSVVYTASDRNDGTGLTDTATLTVTVTGTNDGLTANDDSAATTQNAPLTVADSATGPNADLLLNDVDIDSDDLTITEVGGKSANVGKATAGSGGGSFTIRADGSWDFNPGTAFDDLAAGVTRTTSVVYTASDRNDGTGLTDTATLTVTVTGTNDGLTANDDSAATTQNAPLTVADSATGPNADLLLNDVDIDSDDLTITEVGGKSSNVGKATAGSGGGSFTIRADGSWDFNPGTAFDDLAAGVTKTTSVVYTASDRNDGTGLTDTATLTVTVTGTNDGLTANDDSGTTTQNAPLTVADSATGPNADLLLNDVDIDSDDLTITEVGGKSANVGKATAGSGGGSFTIRADGSWDFNPGTAFDDLAAGVTKTTSVVYTASDRNDGTGLTDTATLTVTVTGTNDGLTANDDSGTTTQNDTLTVAANAGLLQNDKDSDGDELTISEVDGDTASVGKAVDGSNGGEFTIDSEGGWTFNPDGDFDNLADGKTATTSVEYTATDGKGETDTATVIVTVTGANDGLTAEDDVGATTQNDTLTVAANAGLLQNDKDSDGDELTISEVDGDTASVGKAVDGSNGGEFTIDSEGGWTFNPDGDFDNLADGKTATTSVEYTATDGKGETDTATVTVTVTGTNDGLTANDDAGTTTENKILTVADDATGTTSGTTTINADLLRNDVDIDSDKLTITEVGGKSANVGKATDGSDGGSFTIDSKGGWTFNPDGDFDDLKAGVTRTTSVEYTASDSKGETDTATVTVTVTGTNDGLTANDDAGTTTENKILTVADDATGTTSGTTTINADLLRNDVDIDSDKLTITEVGGKSANVGKATDGSDGGEFTIDSKGGWTFNPDGDFDDLKAGVTRTTSVEYTASDSKGETDTATVTVTVTGTNDGLTANDDAGTTTENKILTVADGATGTTSGTTPFNADLLLNDVDIDGDDLTITEVDGDTSSVGKATDGSDGGSFTIRANGSWEFNPGTDFDDLKAGVTKTTSVEYTASDGTLTDTATLTVTVTGSNDGLTANDDAGTTTENTDLTVADDATGTTSGTTTTNADLLLNDVDIDSDDLTITEVDGDTSSVGKATNGSDGGSFTIRANGSWEFNPGTDFDDLKAGVTKTTSVEYTASDGSLTDTATLTVTVTGTNDGLTANDDAGTTTENTDLTVADGATGTTSGTTPGPGGGAQRVNADLLLNDVDIDGDDLTITEVGGDTGSVGKATGGSDGGSFTIRANGSWEFNPGTDFDDLKAGVTKTTSVEYTVSDSKGETDTATVIVTVTGEDDRPMLTADTGTVTEDVADADDKLVTTGTVGASGGDAGDTQFKPETISDTGTHYGSLKIEADGDWTYTADNSDSKIQGLKATDSPTDTFTVTSADMVTKTTVTITINGVNDAPMLEADAALTAENTKLTVVNDDAGTIETNDADSSTMTINADLLLNDSDPDGDTFTITAVKGYTRDTDGNYQQQKDAVPVNDDGTAATPSTPQTTTLGSSGGTFTLYADGSYTFDPGTDFDNLVKDATLTTSVEYTVSDGTATSTATLTVTVTGTNDAPMAVDDFARTAENDKLTVADDAKGTATTNDNGDPTTINADLLINDMDRDGDTLTITQITGFDDQGQVTVVELPSDTKRAEVGGSARGQFTIHADGSWSFDPGTDFDDLKADETRDTLVAYTVSDGKGGTDTKSLTVRVTGADDVPTIAGTTTGTVIEDAADASGNLVASGTLTITDGDAGEDKFKAAPATAPVSGTYGSLTITADGDWTYKVDNSLAAIQDLSPTTTLTDTFTVTSADMVTTTTVTITINGDDDVPALTGATGEVTEDGNLVATGTVGASGGDAGEDKFMTDPETGSYGSLTITANGIWTYTVDNSDSKIQGLGGGETLTDTLTVTSEDGVTTAMVTITINGANDDPTLTASTGMVTEDTAVDGDGNLVATGTVKTEGGDAGEDKFMPTVVGTPLTGAYGSLEIDADGDWTYTAANSQSDIQNLKSTETLTDTFTVTSADEMTTTTVTITINGVEDPVTGVTGTVTEDTSVDGDGNLVATGTIMIGGNAGQFTAATISGSVGSLAIVADGTWTYTAANSQSDIQDLSPTATLTDTFTVTSADGATITITITINGADDMPTLTADTGMVTEDTAVDGDGNLVATGTVGATGGDDGEDQFMTTPVSGAYGTLTIAADGTWTYKAANSQSDIQDLTPTATLTDTLTVTSADMVTTTSVTITINGANDDPTLTGATATLTEDVSVDGDGNLVATGMVTTSGGDTGEDRFVPEITGNLGTLTLLADGTWTYKILNSRDEVQQLAAGDSLVDTIIVTSTDTVTTTSVTITINGADDTPTLPPSTGSVTEDTSVDDDGNLVATGTVSVTGGDAGENGLTAATLTGTYGGTLEVKADGSWTYKLDNSLDAVQGLRATGSLTETFTVTGADGNSTTSVTITINGADDVPTLALSAGTVTEDSAVDGSGNLVATGTITVTGGDTGESTVTAATLMGSYGNLVVLSDGSWTYTADNSQKDIQQLPDSATLSEAFTVTSSDTVTTGSVRIRINGADDVATVTGPMTATLTEGMTDAAGNLQTPNMMVSFTGGDLNEPLGFSRSDSPTNAPFGAALNLGGLTTPANTAIWSFIVANSDPSVQAINPGESLVLTYSVLLADGITRLPFTVTIVGAESALSFAPTTGGVTEDVGVNADGDLTTSGTINALDDAQDLATLRYTAETKTGSYGELTIDAMGAWTYKADNSQDAIQELHQPGRAFLPTGAATELTETFTVTTADGATTTSVTITITGADDTPTLTPSADSVTEDAAADLDSSGKNLVATGKVTITGGDTGESGLTAETLTGSYGNLKVVSDGTWTYTADNSQKDIQQLPDGATLTETFTVTSSDTVTTGSVVIRIIGTDDVPVKGVGEATLTEDSDIDADGTIDAELTANGIVTISGGDADEDSYVLVTVDSAESTLDDTTDTGTATGASGGVLTWQADGTWSYTIDNTLAAVQGLGPSDSLTEVFTFHANDAITQADIAAGNFVDGTTPSDATTTTVTITIRGTNDVPVLTAVTTDPTVTEDSVLTVTGMVEVTGGDSGENELIAETLTGDYGTLTIAADGTWTYELANNTDEVQGLTGSATLTDTLTVTSADGVTTLDVTITITGTDDVPGLTGSTATLTEDTDLDDNGNLVATGMVQSVGGDADEFGFVTQTLTGDVGELRIGAGGVWNYTADNSQAAIQNLGTGDSLIDTFEVTGGDGVTTTTITITINGLGNDEPDLTGATATLTEDTDLDEAGNLMATGRVNNNGGDTGDAGFIAETLTGDVGTLTIDDEGTWTYTADSNQPAIQDLNTDESLTDTFEVTAGDGVTTIEVVITINGLGNDAPGPTEPGPTPPDPEPPGPTPPDPEPPGPTPPGPEQPDPDEPVPVLPEPDTDTDADTDTAVAAVASASDTEADFMPTLPEPRDPDDIFADDDDELITIINPIRLNSPLADQEVIDGIARYDISDLFRHISNGTVLRYMALLANGDPLPYFVMFMETTGTFLFDAAAAAEAGVTSLQIRLVAIDPDGNRTSDVFRVNFQNTDESADEGTDENDDESADGNANDNADENADENADAAPESPEQQNPGPES